MQPSGSLCPSCSRLRAKGSSSTGVEVSAVYTVPSSEAPINLDFRVIANPAFILSQPTADFECNANNNFRDVLDLDCTDVGG